MKGRDVIGMLSLQPGVIDTNPREAPSWNLLSGLNINGRSTGINLTYDGITNRESHGGNLAAPGLDSIAEMRLQSSNFQAEYGRSSGASITLITRSGSSDFRGSAAFYKRDAALNGNEYARVMQCRQGQKDVCEPALYEFDNVAWTLGGPGTRARHGLQQAAQPAVLLLVAGCAGADRSRRAQSTPDAHGARAARRFLPDPRQPRSAGLHPGSAATGKLHRRGRRARLLRRERDPGEPDRCHGPGAAQHVPAAERIGPDRPKPVQLHVPDRHRLAAQRSGAAGGLERRAENDRLRASAVRQREAHGSHQHVRVHGRLAADGGQVRDRVDQLTSTRSSTASARGRFWTSPRA